MKLWKKTVNRKKQPERVASVLGTHKHKNWAPRLQNAAKIPPTDPIFKCRSMLPIFAAEPSATSNILCANAVSPPGLALQHRGGPGRGGARHTTRPASAVLPHTSLPRPAPLRWPLLSSLMRVQSWQRQQAAAPCARTRGRRARGRPASWPPSCSSLW